MVADGAQNTDRLFLHFQQLLQFRHGKTVVSPAHGIRHVEHHRIHHRLSNRINIGLFDLIRTGIGSDLADLAGQGGHGTAGNINEVGTEICGDPLAPGGKMPADPRDQIPLILLGKFNDGSIVIHRIPKLLISLVRFPCHRFKKENDGAVIRDIGEDLCQLLSVRLGELENVDIFHLHHGGLCHHGQRLHRIRKCLQREIFIVKACIVKGFCQVVHQQLLQLAEVVPQKEHFFAMEEIQTIRCL